MKKIFLFILFIIIIAIIYIIQFRTDGDLTNNISMMPKVVCSPTPEKPLFSTPKITFKDKIYHYSLFKVTDLQKIELISNLKNKVSASSLLENKCKTVINAGFYDKNNRHLGSFGIENEIISEPIESKLFNGFFSLNSVYKPAISQAIPLEPYIFALQSGPLLVENGSLWTLNVVNDEEARRVFAGVNLNKELYFGVVFNENENYKGPYLNELPEIIQKIDAKEKLNLWSAINLDGGGASVFYTDKVKLSELTTVGGFFCIN